MVDYIPTERLTIGPQLHTSARNSFTERFARAWPTRSVMQSLFDWNAYGVIECLRLYLPRV